MKSIRIGIYIQSEPQLLHATLKSLRADGAYPLLLLPDRPDAHTAAALDAISDIPQSRTAQAIGAASCFNRLISHDADVYIFLESGVVVGRGWLGRLLAALDADPRNGLAGPSTNRSWNQQALPAAGSSPNDPAARALDVARRLAAETRTLEPLYSLADFCYAVRREVVDDIGGADERFGAGPCWEMDYNIRAARAGWRGVWARDAYVHRAPITARRQLAEAQYLDTSKRLYQDKFCGGRLRGDKPGFRAHCRGDDCPNFAPAALIEIRRPLRTPGTTLDESTKAAAPESSADLPSTQVIVAAEPLVSCIMPTRDRRAFVPQAINYFLRQDYPDTELIVVDDGADAIADILPADPRIRYIRLERPLTVGAKRNLACGLARGDVILHWDDDDWYPPRRVRIQAAALRDGNDDICGSAQVYYYDAAKGRAWRYHYPARPPQWVAGNTLAYRKSYWERKPFPDIQVGEDVRFIREGQPRGIRDLADPGLCVAMIHPANISPKITTGINWQALPDTQIKQLLGDDFGFYVGGARSLAKPVLPLVSCIMPTYNRRAFIPLAISAFEAQDYPRKELIVVDDGNDPVADLLQGRPEIQYVRLPGRLSIGAKRNAACERASGDIIAHWDDDDWYANDRLRYQVMPLISGEAEITGLENAHVLELPSGVFWTTHAALHKRMFVGDVHGGTLAYIKKMLNRGLRYPAVSLAEDAALLSQAMRQGQRLTRLANHGVFVYVRHANNAWSWKTGEFLDPAGWLRSTAPDTFPAHLLPSYQNASTVLVGATG